MAPEGSGNSTANFAFYYRIILIIMITQELSSGSWAGVSTISKNRFFHKTEYSGFEFFYKNANVVSLKRGECFIIKKSSIGLKRA